MKDENNIKDWRSTGRRIGRRTLFKSMRTFMCEEPGCLATTMLPPKDAPAWFDDIWPEENRTQFKLEVQHTTKDLRDNSEELLKWMCPKHHKLEDLTTGKGQSTLSQKRFF